MIRGLVAYTLYGVGHLVSLAMHMKYGYWLYPLYNYLMCTSYDIQGLSTKGPWKI